MRVHAANRLEADIRRRDEIVHDAHTRFAGDGQIGGEQQIVVAMDGAGEAVLDWRHAALRVPLRHLGKHPLE